MKKTQKQNNRIVILLSGKMGSGKTTLANYLVYQHNFKVYKFSNVIYDFVNRLGIPKDRRLMQVFGSTIRSYDPNFFARVTIETIKRDNPERAVIDDWRYVNEYEETLKLKPFGYKIYTIRLECPLEELKRRLTLLYPTDFNESQLQHESETALDDFDKFDKKINTYTLSKPEIFNLLDSIINSLI